MILLYTTGCPNCKILERTLTKLNISYEKVENFNSDELIQKSGIFSAPILFYEDEFSNKQYYNFYQSMELIKKLSDEGKI